jgi:hypothetical protein
MRINGMRGACAFLTVLAFAGCGPRPAALPPPADTGAGAKATEFFEALLHEDWQRAYASLDADSKAWCSGEKFADLARHHREQIGFTPTEVHVGANENGDTAAAVANFRGLSGTSIKHSSDGTALRRTGDGWAVVLRANFGRDAARPAPGPQAPRKG